MAVSFANIHVGKFYSRKDLAISWGYKGFQALARGVVTPRNDNKIILFVTVDKQDCMEPYADQLNGRILEWEGPTDHFAEKRMVDTAINNDEIHLFFRTRHHSDFMYAGRLIVLHAEKYVNQPSRFRFELV